MINLLDLKSFLISRLKADALVQASLPAQSKQDIRETEWQGTEFKFPNIRVHIEKFERNRPGADCNVFDYIAHIYVLADDASSMLTDYIAATVWSVLDTKSIGNGTIKLMNIKAVHYGAVWIAEAGTWRSEVTLTGQAS